MIVSVHLADVGRLNAQRLLLRGLDASRVPGMSYSEVVFAAKLGSRSANRIPRPQPGRIGLIAAWEDDDALDSFLAEHPFAARLAGGWHTRLEPLRCFGTWAGMSGLPERELPVQGDEPVAALTLGRLRLTRTPAFLRSALPAERDAAEDPAVLAVTGFGRFTPPRLVSTFSIWRSADAMRRYAFDKSGSHQAAVKVDRAHPFHSESAFIRFRPYASRGNWDGRNPLGAVETR
ncbi:MAG TPA: hypothetical protein VFN89_08960 [Solirubrobacterales bacterium]|nr:hypothetical protein [Solirubrobacterales bacterium]